MLPSFTVVTGATRIFRTKITKLSGDIKLTANQSDVFFDTNFDSYRTFTSPAAASGTGDRPAWPEYEMFFNYETELSHLLLAKRASFAFYCKDSGDDIDSSRHFLGEASVDLLSLAAGPSKVSLTLFDGDVVKGSIDMDVQMEELAETSVTFNQVTVKLHRKVPINDLLLVASTSGDQVTWDKELPETMRGALNPIPTGGTNAAFQTFAQWNQGELEPVTHYYGTSLTELFEVDGVTFVVSEKGVLTSTVLGKATVRLGIYLAPNADEKSFSPRLEFAGVPLMDDDSGQEVGEISGVLILKNIPKFVQMYAGQNIDGVIFGGQRYAGAQMMPAQISNETINAA